MFSYMQNGLFKLYSNDIVKGIATAIFAAAFMVVAAVVLAPNFDVFVVNWGQLGHTILNTSVVTFVAYILKNFLSTNQGSVLNITPNDKPVS